MRHAADAGAHAGECDRHKAFFIRQHQRGTHRKRHVFDGNVHSRFRHRRGVNNAFELRFPTRCQHGFPNPNWRILHGFAFDFRTRGPLDHAGHPAAHEAQAVRRIHDHLCLSVENAAMNDGDLHTAILQEEA